MSAGGQRGIDISGVNTLRVQDASDFTHRANLRLIYHAYGSSIGANAYAGDNPAGTGALLDFLAGTKEISNASSGCQTCVGLPYTMGVSNVIVWAFRNPPARTLQ
jgi:hypothetical protein